jgi:hypothetical protein
MMRLAPVALVSLVVAAQGWAVVAAHYPADYH